MRISAKQFFYVLLGLNVVMQIASLALVYFFIPASNAPFIIQYRMFGGGDVFGDRWALFIGPCTALIVLAVNAIMAYVVFAKERRFSLMLLGMTAVYQAFMLAYSLILIRVNTY